MSTFEDGQQEQQQTLSPQSLQQPHTPLRLANEESSNNNNSIMGKVKLRVSSILPGSLGKWFSPTTEGAARADSVDHSPSQQQQQQNGSVLTVKRKRSQRRIELEADDAPDIMDDGYDAQDLNDEEVQLADNIAEHDLVAEDEQTRRNEYNLSLLRKRQMVAAVAAAAASRDFVNNNNNNNNNDDDDEDDDDLEDEEDDEQDDDVLNYQQQQPNRNPLGFKTLKPFGSSNATAHQPPAKRTRFEQSDITFSPQFNARRRPQLHASTPAVGDAALRTHAPPNRLAHLKHHGHLKLYGQQREPAFNFLAAGSSSEAAVATSGDLPMSSRRSLNIPPLSERRDSLTTTATMLPSYKRQSLLGQHGLNMRNCSPISEVTQQQEQQQQQTTIIRQETNNNNNNNNIVINAKQRATDSHSECESNESQHVGLGLRSSSSSNNNIGNNSNLLFYGNLQSRKSVFNANAVTPQHHNSTLSLNSLNNRRRFNASIYGSTSALSDSRLLSSSLSTTSGSPFYHGPTAFGGNSANNRYFSQGNLANIINSGGSSPAPSNSDSNSNATVTATPRICLNYQMKPVEMRPNKTGTSSGATNAADTGGLSQTAQRILNLLENHTTPLMDAKKMGSTLREHQQQRSSRHTKKPYSYPTAYGGYNHSYQTTSNSNNNTSNSNNNNTAEQDNDSSKLLVPTMLQLLERRRLQRVTTASTRQLINAKQQQLQLKQQQSRTTAAVATSCAAATGATVNSSANSSLASAPHTNKMRSRLSHQTRKDARNIMDEQLPPPPIDLPDIRFPTMAQEPKFELSFKSTATSGTKLNSIDCSSSNNNSIKSKFNANNNYNFEAPLSINNSLQSHEDDSNNVPQKRVKHNFIFVPPTPLEEQQQQEQLQQKERSNDLQLNGDKSLKTSGSVMDILLPKTAATPTPTVADAAVIGASATSFSDFGERFKKPAGNWECDACMVSNKAEAAKCIACETPKKTAAPKATATVAPTAAIQGFAGFGNCFKKPAGNWECDACMVSNKAEAAKCIACETPRKNATAAATTAAVAPVSATFGTAVAGGFGDAFKPKANTWQCDTCMITNESKDNLCVACQTPNPKAKNTSSSTATTAATAASSFSFGFGGKAATTPKPDAGFQQLIAAQKSSSWTCEVCTAQNDVARNKCICCEQLKPGATAEVEDKTSSVPKFMFGFSSSTAAAAATTAAASATTSVAATVTASTAAPFKFGFAAAGKDVADKADNTTTTATTLKTSLATATTPTNLKFGAAAATPGSKTVAFKLSEPQQMQEQQKQQQQTKTAEAADTTAPVSSKAPATSSTGLGLFTPAAGAATSTAATLNKPAATFAFGSSSSNLNTSTATTTAAAPTAEASSKLFSFGSFTGTTSTMSSNSGSNTTTSSSSNSNNSAKPAAPIFSFGASSSLQQPAATTSATPTVFGQPSPLFAAAVAAKTGTTTATAAVKTVTTPAAFVFGSQANIAAATTATNTANSNTSNFFFGSPATPAAAAAATTTTAATTTAATPVAGNNMNLFSSSSLSKSSSIAGTPNTTPIFSFGSGSSSINNTSGSSAFTFGSKPAIAATVAPTPSATTTTSGGSNTFGWPTAAAAGTAATPTQFASFGSVAGSSATATTTTNATPFSSSGLSGGSGVSSIFGNVSNPFNNSSSNTAATPAPMSNIFNTAGTGGSNNSSTTTVAAATTTSIDKPIFQFGAATAPGTASTEVFNFGGGQSNPSVIAKPAFNFSGAGATTQPQTAAFNFTGSVGANVTGSASSGGNNNTGLGGNNSNKTDLFPTTERLFQFGAPAPTTVNLAAAGSGAGESSLSSSSSSIVPAAGQLFNFTGSTQQMQSTPNAAAPFQFNAGALAPTNIFAFNPPNAGNNMQNPRRKIRAPMRRLPPR